MDTSVSDDNCLGARNDVIFHSGFYFDHRRAFQTVLDSSDIIAAHGTLSYGMCGFISQVIFAKKKLTKLVY